MSGSTVVLHAVIAARPSTVFAVLADWRRNVVWEQELLDYSPLTEEPVGAGSRFQWERQIGQRRIRGVQVVTSFVPGRLLGTEVSMGPVPFQSMVTLTPTVDGTSTAVHVELTHQPRGLLRLLALPMARALENRATGNLQSLKNLVEQEAEQGLSPGRSAQEGAEEAYACPEV